MKLKLFSLLLLFMISNAYADIDVLKLIYITTDMETLLEPCENELVMTPNPNKVLENCMPLLDYYQSHPYTNSRYQLLKIYDVSNVSTGNTEMTSLKYSDVYERANIVIKRMTALGILKSTNK